MGKIGDTQTRFGPPAHRDELERLCGYLKNDSMVRWATGASQAQVDEARAAVERRRAASAKPRFIRSSDDTGQDDMQRRRKLAIQANRRYLHAVSQAQR